MVNVYPLCRFEARQLQQSSQLCRVLPEFTVQGGHNEEHIAGVALDSVRAQCHSIADDRYTLRTNCLTAAEVKQRLAVKLTLQKGTPITDDVLRQTP